MIKAVNMKNFRFGKNGNVEYIGFGMWDEETNEFCSFDGFRPYVLAKKKYIDSCIAADWAETLKRVKPTLRKERR